MKDDQASNDKTLKCFSIVVFFMAELVALVTMYSRFRHADIFGQIFLPFLPGVVATPFAGALKGWRLASSSDLHAVNEIARASIARQFTLMLILTSVLFIFTCTNLDLSRARW